MELLQHFSHGHPLILLNKEELKHDGDDHQKVRCCDGCLDPIFSDPSYYRCSGDGCEYFLHKVCAELPLQMKHPLHPHHPLTLFASSPYAGDLNCVCDVCGEDWNNFTYHCSMCKFDICVICAERNVEHKHQLTPMRKPALFLCDACGTKHEGFFYICTTCPQFWIHRDCASLPTTIKHTDHQHPLTLAYSLPHEYSKFQPDCDICSKHLDLRNWAYYCAECRYFAHVNCATSKIEPFMLILSPGYKSDILTKVEDLNPNVIHLPLHDDSVSAINYFLKEMASQEEENKRVIELNHFSHNHPLILYEDVQRNDELCSGSKLSPLNKMKNDKVLCDGCVLPISAPFYSCSQCNFFLHKWCAKLPTQLQHSCHHEHPLTLLTKSPKFFGLFWCDCCGFRCNGFAFHCPTCQLYLDVKCASLPGVLTHEAHTHHVLVLRTKISNRCNACFCDICDYGYGCDSCLFNLHVDCALFSHIGHRYGEHSFTLTYHPIINRDCNEYYCEICEGN